MNDFFSQSAPVQPLDVWSRHFSIPVWQQAALAQLMHWEDGKHVDQQSYASALARLEQRRMGGGRGEE